MLSHTRMGQYTHMGQNKANIMNPPVDTSRTYLVQRQRQMDKTIANVFIVIVSGITDIFVCLSLTLILITHVL